MVIKIIYNNNWEEIIIIFNYKLPFLVTAYKVNWLTVKYNLL